jgi:hypothetical protein
MQSFRNLAYIGPKRWQTLDTAAFIWSRDQPILIVEQFSYYDFVFAVHQRSNDQIFS